ncbi:MAG: phosphoserine phosphatase SerB [Bacteriovoracaceae bacterium]
MAANKQLVLVTVTGMDKPGITHNLMEIIAGSQATILDMGQSVTHGLLSLSILLDVEQDDDSPLLKDLLFTAKKMELALDFNVMSADVTDNRAFEKERFVLSCVSQSHITPAFMRDITEVMSKNKMNIMRIDNMNISEFSAVDIMIRAEEPVVYQDIKTTLLSVSNTHQIDVAFMRDNVFRYNKRLIVFDMDSTLIQAEVIDEMAKVHGVGAKVISITERAMNGELDFNAALIERVALLKGMKVEKLEEILAKIELTDGTEQFIRTVKALGYKVAVISGGFTYFTGAFKKKLGLDYAFANELEIENGALTGKVLGNIVNAEGKALLLNLISQQEQISLEQVVAIGDGANDLPMLAKAGLGIAFHAKEIVRKKAGHHMSHGPMTSILYFLGIPEKKVY